MDWFLYDNDLSHERVNKTDCPLQEKCLSENTPYQADICSENFQTKIHCGTSETKFKTRYL